MKRIFRFIVLLFICCFFNIKLFAQPEIKADWIAYDETSTKDNSWTIYRKAFDVNKLGTDTIIANIAIDSGKACEPPWNALWKRPIPLWRDSGLIAYENDGD